MLVSSDIPYASGVCNCPELWVGNFCCLMAICLLLWGTGDSFFVAWKANQSDRNSIGVLLERCKRFSAVLISPANYIAYEKNR